MLKLSMWIGALILVGLVQGAQDAQDVLGRLWPPAFRITVLVSIHQYSSVLASSFRIARRGRRAFTGNRAIRMAETEPLMQACYSFVKEHCSAGLNCLSGRLLGGSKRDNAQQRQNVKALAPKDLAEFVTGPGINSFLRTVYEAVNPISASH